MIFQRSMKSIRGSTDGRCVWVCDWLRFCRKGGGKGKIIIASRLHSCRASKTGWDLVFAWPALSVIVVQIVFVGEEWSHYGDRTTSDATEIDDNGILKATIIPLITFKWSLTQEDYISNFSFSNSEVHGWEDLLSKLAFIREKIIQKTVIYDQRNRPLRQSSVE